MRDCPFCAKNMWEPWVFKGHSNMYLCRKCYAFVPWEKIDSRPVEDALRDRLLKLQNLEDNN